MNSLLSKRTGLGCLAVFGLLFTLGGCAGDSVRTELPANHPANPTAEAAVFTPPPNPFVVTVTEAPPVSPSADTAVRPELQEGAGHNHDMGPIEPRSAEPADSMQKDTGHQH